MEVKSTKKYSPSLRLWHWLNALIISALLLTVFINENINNRELAVSAYNANKENIAVAEEQIKSVVHQQQEIVWEWHIYLGYALIALFIFRLILEIFQPYNQKFFQRIALIKNKYKLIGKPTHFYKNSIYVKYFYLLFYFLIILMILTGLTIVYAGELGLDRGIKHDVKEIHGFIMYLIIFFILTHIIGVIWAERKGEKGITSDMINGCNDNIS